uniref:RPP7 n=1 Tax=Arabidopsis thaliana TaxID=3702 RepID=S5ZZ02_ARATH|nr:RPP7 [Arabidopsis thaliana]AGT37271.1 RPP7 [Arabidopsis thaliana]
MAGELVSFAVNKLWDLLSHEYTLFQGVEDQVAELKSDLNLLKSFLKDADAKKHTSALVRYCVEEIKDIVYDAEDVLETFVQKEKLGKTSGIRKHIKRLTCIVPDRREIALYIGHVSKRITRVIRDMQSFGVQQMIVDDYMHPLRNREREIRRTFPKDNESGFVALEENVKKLVGYFVEEDNYQVVSITGMGGLGKTTLARQVFNHDMVTKKFDKLAWVSVSQDFTLKNVWQNILGDLKPKEEEKKILEMTEYTLQRELYQLLEMSKSLIVLDDIWKKEDWEVIKPIFPPTKGWKLLLTSRNESIVAPTNTKYFNFKPECLKTDDSWKLFQRIAFPINDASEFEIDEEMEKLGEKMIEHCGGLPLAIKVLGGMLAEKYTSHDWRRLSENIGSHLVGGRTNFNDDNNNSCNYVLSLSFEELPSYLKHCFLYLAHFPEDYEIKVENLSYYWAAEEIFQHRHYDGEIIRDVGDVYIEELVRRNMVISERDVKTSRFETCHLHDMMREVCLLKAKEENFLQITSNPPSTANFQSTVTSRRLVYQYPTTLHVEKDINNPKLRSLVVVTLGSWNMAGSSFTRLELLRVLDLVQAKLKGGKLASCIGKLIHLRYLSLEYAEVTHIPYSLGNLKLLIYLNLHISLSSRSNFVPNVLMGMQELRYLALPSLIERKTKLELSNLVKLETLENFSTKNSSLEDLRGMVRLRTLTIELIEETSLETLAASIGGLKYLEKLEIDDLGSKMRTKEAGIVFDFVHLKRLRLELYMPRLSKEQHFPSHLTTLYLQHCRLEEDPMPILEKLLQLKELELGHKSFSGKKMVCSSCGFPQLQKLSISGLKEWEDWKVEESSMPLLHTLDILNCRKLKQLPDKHLPSHLTAISLKKCGLEDPIPTLERLVHLKELSLSELCGRIMVCTGGGFPQLHKLDLSELDGLEEWIVEDGSMPRLHTLEIRRCLKLKKLPNGFPQLQNLHLTEVEEWEEGMIVKQGSMPLLHTLYIWHCPKLPGEQHFPSHLTTVFLLGMYVEEDPMRILEKLLHLKNVTLFQSFSGKRMVCSGGGFPQLQKLSIREIEWEEWIVEQGSMPLLHTLYIGVCPNLKELPDGLRFIYSLKNLIVSKRWKKRLSEGGEDYYKVQHIPSVEFDD